MTDGISGEMRKAIIDELVRQYPTPLSNPRIQMIVATLRTNPNFLYGILPI
jgi:hypothetical protein